jgi:hypothetical protein
MRGWDLTDPIALEQKLKPYTEVVIQIQAMVFWKNWPLMVGVLLAVNSFFALAYVLELTALATTILLFAIKAVIELVNKLYGEVLISWLFPAIKDDPNAIYRIYPLHDVCRLAARISSMVVDTYRLFFPSYPFNQSTIWVVLVSIASLFLFFYAVGAWLVNIICVNGLLLLPAILLHPRVKPYVRQYFKL